MERGLLWLPLLIVFFGLAWSGWNEYQKVEAYKVWAEPFERAKYDIYAVLGQNNALLTWGKPTRKGPVNLETFSLKDVREIRLVVNKQLADLDSPPARGKPALEFELSSDRLIRIPFTETVLAAKWGKFLQQQALRLE
ncbi:MAG: hypothetical protein ACFB4I_22285 [Cyanophyceae cyanobacterium]